MKLLLAAVLIFTSNISSNPIKWNFELSKPKPQIGEIVTLNFNGELQNDWYVYGTVIEVKEGPLSTKVSFETNDSFELLGQLEAVDAVKKYDEIWGGNVTYMKKKAHFTQKIKILKSNFKIKGIITSQTCNETSGNCVLNKDAFSIK